MKYQELLNAIIPPSPFCRDCADNDGTCPSDGLPCDPHDRALLLLKGRTFDPEELVQNGFYAGEKAAERAFAKGIGTALSAELKRHAINYEKGIDEWNFASVKAGIERLSDTMDHYLKTAERGRISQIMKLKREVSATISHWLYRTFDSDDPHNIWGYLLPHGLSEELVGNEDTPDLLAKEGE